MVQIKKIQIRLTDENHRELKARANSVSQTISGYVKHKLFLDRDLPIKPEEGVQA